MRVVQLVTQGAGGPVDHAVDVACRLRSRGVDSHVVGPEGPAAARARAAGVVWHAEQVRDKRDAAGAARVAGLLRSLRADVTHLQDRRAGWIGRLLSRRLDGPVVYTLHGVPDGLSDRVGGNALAAPRRRRDPLLYLHAERWLARWSRGRVVVPSEAVARYARDHVGLPAAIVDVVPNGVDLDLYRPREHTPGATSDRTPHHPVQPADPPGCRAVWLGLLGEVKRPGLLLDAVARVPDLHLDLLGDGPLAGQVAERAGRPDLAGRVVRPGAVTDAADRLPRADVFVLTSAAENLPLALLQAMACGLPVVATAVGGIPEVVRPGREGLLVPPDDLDALVAALTRVTADAGARAAWGRAARERVEAAYGLDRCVEGLLEVYARAGARG